MASVGAWREVSPFNISLSHVDPEARAGAGDDAAAAAVGDDPWTASEGEARHETPNLMVCDPSTPVPDATHAPGSRYGAHVDAFCCHHLDFAQKGWPSGAARDQTSLSCDWKDEMTTGRHNTRHTSAHNITSDAISDVIRPAASISHSTYCDYGLRCASRGNRWAIHSQNSQIERPRLRCHRVS